MHFSVSSSSSPAAARIAVSVLPLLLLISAQSLSVTADVAAAQTADLYSAEPTFAVARPDSPVIERLPEVSDASSPEVSDAPLAEVSYDVTDSPDAATDVPEEASADTTVVAAGDSLDLTAVEEEVVTTEAPGLRWIQKIPRKRPSGAKSSKSLKAPEVEDDDDDSESSALKSPGNPLALGQVLSNILYGPPWSAVHTNSKCTEDMRIFNVHMQNYTLWAAKMMDATAKVTSGLLDGNTFSFGNFDQCLSIKSKNYGISGGYSLVDIKWRPTYQVHPGFYNDTHLDDYELLDPEESAWEAINHNIQDDYIQRYKFQWAVCLPDTCDYEDVKKIVSDVLLPEMKRYGLEADVSMDPMLHTSHQNTYKYTAGFYLVCITYILVSGLVFLGTLYDLIFLYYKPKSEHGPLKNIMKPFSLISNIQRLLKPSETEEFSIINGMKFCSILQIIPGHRWFSEFGSPQKNPDWVYWIVHNPWMGYFKCAVFLETFFVISGFLTFYLITKQLIEKKRLNFIPIMIYRWLRIFPVYATLIATYVFILPYMNDGPYWRKMIYRETERCQNNWWTNALFINNYVHTDELCIIPSWYMACDMHFFIVGTLLTYTIWRWRKQGLILLGACFTLSITVPIYFILNEQQRGVISVVPESLHDLSKDRFYTEVYIKSHMRAMTYLVGLFAGYLYIRLKEADYKLSLKSRIICVPACLAIGNIIYLVNGIFYVVGDEYNAYEHALFFTVARLVWAVLISYGIIGHGLSGLGVCISGFLGHRVFHVLGKLVFCIYMFQELIQLQTIASMKDPTYQSLTLMGWRFVGDAMMAILYAFCINVMVESPFDRVQKNVMKIFMGDLLPKKKSQHPIDDVDSKNDNLAA